jgi:hypothetical protein
MKTLTIHERINFKSHYPAETLPRIKRVDHYGHCAENGNYKSFNIPYWVELQKNFVINPFKAKY